MCTRRAVQELRSKAIAHESEVNFPFIATFSDAVTREQLYRICRTSDLHTVRYLEVTLDLTRTPIHHLLEHLPSLRQLVLTTNGPMTSIRELGINAKNLIMIHISNSGIQDLDGISSLTSVVELRLSNNKINDLSPLALHDTLEILDLSRNLVDEIVSCEILGTCKRLISLDLTDNPVSLKTKCFRSMICHWIPQVSELIYAVIINN
jgi:Leucine-rich repeat (LRR) protein